MVNRKIALSYTLCLLLAFSLQVKAESVLKTNTAFQEDGLSVIMLNWDLARNKKVVFVHFELRNHGKHDKRCRWDTLSWLVRPEGDLMSSNHDALVDSGHGFIRASGPVLIKRDGRRIRISVPFLLSEGDLPARIQIANGLRSPILK